MILRAMNKGIFRNRIWPFVRIVLAGIVSLFILSLFSMVYCFSGVHIRNESGSTDYKWESGQRKANMTEGFSWLKMDANGFNNDKVWDKTTRGIDILIIGSSHMEATEVPGDSNAGVLLGRLLPEYSVYNIGMPGHDIYRCAKNLHNAVTEYDPGRYVVLETDTIDITETEARAVLQGGIKAIPSYDKGLLYMLQKYIPATKNIFKQIEDWYHSEIVYGRKSYKREAASDETLAEFLRKMVCDCGGDRQLILLYHPPTHIDENGKLMFEEEREAVWRFAEGCEQADILFVDMTDDFAAMYSLEFVQAHGFINTAIGVGHLNAFGHKCIAEKLARTVREGQG